jgi:type VI protein secretion system component VasF
MKKNEIATYAPEEDDGELAYSAIMEALGERDEIEAELLEKFAAPGLRTILNIRASLVEFDDAEFFRSVFAVVADFIGAMTEAVVSNGNEAFARNALLVIGSILAHKLGHDAIPEKEEILNILRRFYN